jgi:hypothetical protein
MGLNKEKIMPVVRVRVKGQKLAKSVKRAMAFMGTGANAYKLAMLDAARTYESNRKKTFTKDKVEEK